MQPKLSWHEFKSDCCNFRIVYAVPIVTTRERATEYTKKEMRKGSKCVTTKKLKHKGKK
jgi:hypothetical protein